MRLAPGILLYEQQQAPFKKINVRDLLMEMPRYNHAQY